MSLRNICNEGRVEKEYLEKEEAKKQEGLSWLWETERNLMIFECGFCFLFCFYFFLSLTKFIVILVKTFSSVVSLHLDVRLICYSSQVKNM